MTRLLALLFVVSACQQRAQPPATGSAAAPAAAEAVSRAEPSAPPAAPPAPPRPPAPPLPDQLPGHRRDISAIAGAATRAAIADLDGDGHAELALVDPQAVRVVDRTGRELARLPAEGGIEVLTAADLDRGRRAVLLAGWGMSREHRDARAHVTLLRLDHGKLAEELVFAPSTTRQDIQAVIPDGGELLIGYFDSKYTVTKVVAKRAATGWVTSDPITIRMATSWALGDLDGHGKRSIVVGRLYGDARGLDGDAFVLAPDGTRRVLPTTRGVQALAVADTDGDGRAEIFVGDGWHQNYAANARGLLTWIHPAGGAFRSELVEDTPGQFTIWQILVADVDGDGKPELVTRGSSYVRVYKRAGASWRGLTIAGLARDIAIGDLDGTGPEIVVLGEHSEVVDLHGVTW